MHDEPANLAEALQAEITRVRDQVLPAYVEIGPPGAFALMFIRQDLDAAVRALAEGDAVACLRMHAKLKDTHT